MPTDARTHALRSLVLPPISTKKLTAADVDDLTRNTREIMLTALISLTESPMGQKATTVNRGPAIGLAAIAKKDLRR